MLKQYDYLEAVLKENNSRQFYAERKMSYFVSEVMESLNINDASEINNSMNRAFQACYTLNIPFDFNFKKVYRFDGENLISDWKISELACYLIIINSTPSNQNVAKAQVFFAMNRI